MSLYTRIASNSTLAEISANDLQAEIDLQELAAFLLDDAGLPAGNCLNFVIPSFDPDHPEYLVHTTHFESVVTRDRGSSILFVQRFFNCSKHTAIGFLRGWLARSRYRPAEQKFIQAVMLPPKPIQLTLFNSSHLKKVAR